MNVNLHLKKLNIKVERQTDGSLFDENNEFHKDLALIKKNESANSDVLRLNIKV